MSRLRYLWKGKKKAPSKRKQVTLGGLELPTLCLEGRCSNPAELKRQVGLIYRIKDFFSRVNQEFVIFCRMQPSKQFSALRKYISA